MPTLDEVKDREVEIDGAFASVVEESEEETDQELEASEVAALPVDELLALADRLLVERKEHVATQEENVAAMKAEIQRVREGWDILIAQEEERITRNELLLAEIAKHLDFHGKKSRNLPEGRIGWRKVAMRVDVEDSDIYEAWVLNDDERIAQLAVPLKGYKFPKEQLKAYVKTTGEVPPGCDVKDEHDKFYVQ